MLIGVLQQQPHGVSPPTPADDIVVETISVTPSGDQFIGSYTTSGNSEKNQLPIATNLQLTGFKNVGQEINASWDYFHINNSTEGSTEIEIQTADDEEFDVDLQTVAVSSPYTIEASDYPKWIRLKVTPKTSDGTTGQAVYTQGALVGNTLVQKQIRVSLGPAGKAFSNSAWNLAHTDNPDGTYNFQAATGSYLKNSDGIVIPNLNLDVFTAFSDNPAGPSNAGINGASEFIAGSSAGFWYPASGERQLVIQVPAGGLGIGIGEIKLCCAITSGTNAGNYKINNDTILLPNVTATTPDSTEEVPGNIAFFQNVDMSGNITVSSTDGTGLSPVNCFILYYYEES